MDRIYRMNTTAWMQEVERRRKPKPRIKTYNLKCSNSYLTIHTMSESIKFEWLLSYEQTFSTYNLLHKDSRKSANSGRSITIELNGAQFYRATVAVTGYVTPFR